jgi:hypothetical protein
VKRYDTDDLISYSDMEKRLRDVGLSQKAAKIWVSGFKAIPALYQRDVEEQPDEPAQKPPDKPEPTSETVQETQVKQEPEITQSPAPVVMDVSGLLHQSQVQALYADFQQTKARLGLR